MVPDGGGAVVVPGTGAVVVLPGRWWYQVPNGDGADGDGTRYRIVGRWYLVPSIRI